HPDSAVRRAGDDVGARRPPRGGGVALVEDSHRVRHRVRRRLHARFSLHARRMTSPGQARADTPRVFDWLFALAVMGVVALYIRALVFTPIEALQGAAQ